MDFSAPKADTTAIAEFCTVASGVNYETYGQIGDYEKCFMDQAQTVADEESEDLNTKVYIYIYNI